MKKILNVITVFCLVFATSCGDDDRFSEDPTSGWVDFEQASSVTGQTASVANVPVSINVPVYKEGLTISYTLQAADGDFTQYVTQENMSGTVYADPSDYSRIANIQIPLMNMDEGRSFETSFDVVLTAVDNGIGVGVDESSLVSHRVIIPCSNPDELPADFFVGDYSIQDVVANIGPSNGTPNFLPGTVTLIANPTNPNQRLFITQVYPGFVPEDKVVVIDFNSDDNVVYLEEIPTGIGCSSVQILFSAESAENATPWSICNDQSITVTYLEDSQNSCGGPLEASFQLVKL